MISTERDETKLKCAYAEQLLRFPHDPYKAALIVTGNQPPLALRISAVWGSDPIVLEFQKHLVEEFGEEHFLPSKSSVLHKIYDRAERTEFNDDFVKLHRLAADMRGHIEKPGVNISNTTNVTVNKVMQVPVLMVNNQSADIGAWESALIAQQEKLIEQ